MINNEEEAMPSEKLIDRTAKYLCERYSMAWERIWSRANKDTKKLWRKQANDLFVFLKTRSK